MSSCEIFANAASTDASSPTSHESHWPTPASPPSAISRPKTVAPPDASICAVASPIPEPAPVTAAVRPLNSDIKRLPILFHVGM